MKELLVQDIMTETVLSVRENESLLVAYDLMSEYHIRHLPVVDEEEDVIGLISHRDLVAGALYADNTLPISQLQELLAAMRVKEVMVRSVVTVGSEESAAEAGRLMLENKIGCLPVVEANTLTGILTESDFVRYVVNSQSQLHLVKGIQ